MLYVGRVCLHQHLVAEAVNKRLVSLVAHQLFHVYFEQVKRLGKFMAARGLFLFTADQPRIKVDLRVRQGSAQVLKLVFRRFGSQQIAETLILALEGLLQSVGLLVTISSVCFHFESSHNIFKVSQIYFLLQKRVNVTSVCFPLERLSN